MLSLKTAILGKSYELSIGYLSEKEIKKINKKYRHKDKPTNVLSFAYEKNFGELLLCPTLIKKEARKLKCSHRKWTQILVIHGMLHLKGMQHGSKMEEAEKKYSRLLND